MSEQQIHGEGMPFSLRWASAAGRRCRSVMPWGVLEGREDRVMEEHGDEEAPESPALRGSLVQEEAGGGNRTRVASLEGWSSTIELHPPIHHPLATAVLSLVEGVGFEPT